MREIRGILMRDSNEGDKGDSNEGDKGDSNEVFQ